MAPRYLVALFTFLFIFSSMSYGTTIGAFEGESEVSAEIQAEIKTKNRYQHSPNCPEANTFNRKTAVPFRMQRLILYFHDYSHHGKVENLYFPYLESLYKTGPPNFLFHS